MRKFFCLSAGLAMCSFAGMTQAAQPKSVQPQLLDKGIQVSPIRVAGIDRNLNLTTPWFDVANGGTAACPPTALAFDAFEPDGGIPGFPTDGLYGEDCGLGGSRWFFGPSYCNMFIVNDMTLAPGFTGAASERPAWGWYWYGDGNSAGSEQCFVAVFTAEDFDDSCAGPAATNYYSGILYDFGALGTNPGGYYFTDLQDGLCGSGLFHQMPTDDSGAYAVVLANAIGTGGTLYLATCGQMMLWGTKGGNPSSQGAIQWDDDNPIDGTHTAPDECYDYTFGLCPDPLGAMMCFYAEGGETDCLSLSVDSNFAGSPATFTVSGDPNVTVAVLYSFRTGSFQFTGFGWCVDLGLFFSGLSDAQSKILGQGNTNGSGVFNTTVPIPCAAGNLTVFFQAAQRGTCPDPCSSNVLEVTFVPC